MVPSDDGEWQWKPLTFLNDYVGIYQVAAEYDNFAHLRVRDAKLVKELSEFAAMWDRNLKHQGFIDAFQRAASRRDGCTLHGTGIGETSAVQ